MISLLFIVLQFPKESSKRPFHNHDHAYQQPWGHFLTAHAMQLKVFDHPLLIRWNIHISWHRRNFAIFLMQEMWRSLIIFRYHKNDKVHVKPSYKCRDAETTISEVAMWRSLIIECESFILGWYCRNYMMFSKLLQETTISEVEGEEGNFLAGPEWKVA